MPLIIRYVWLHGITYSTAGYLIQQPHGEYNLILGLRQLQYKSSHLYTIISISNILILNLYLFKGIIYAYSDVP